MRKIFKKDSYNNITASSIVFAIMLGLFFAILILFAQYRMRLTAYTQEILLYLVIPFVVFISVLFFISKPQFKELVSKNYLHFVFMGVFVLTFLITPTKVLVSAIWPNEPEIQEALTEHLKNPSDKDAERKAFKLIEEKEDARMQKEMEEYNKVNRR